MKNWKDHISHWGRWSTATEVKRGLLHFSVGLSAWLTLHPLYLSDLVVWVALCSVAFAFASVEGVKVIADRTNAVWARQVVSRLVNQFARENELRGDRTTIALMIAGCFSAWALCPRWICALAGLLLGMVDPVSKFGKRFPLGVRFKNGKSRGGMLFGFCAGVMAATWVSVGHLFSPIFPVDPSAWHIFAVYAVGVLSAPILEVLGGRWDNFLLPFGTAVLMSLTDIVVPF